MNNQRSNNDGHNYSDPRKQAELLLHTGGNREGLGAQNGFRGSRAYDTWPQGGVQEETGVDTGKAPSGDGRNSDALALIAAYQAFSSKQTEKAYVESLEVEEMPAKKTSLFTGFLVALPIGIGMWYGIFKLAQHIYLEVTR